MNFALTDYIKINPCDFDGDAKRFENVSSIYELGLWMKNAFPLDVIENSQVTDRGIILNDVVIPDPYDRVCNENMSLRTKCASQASLRGAAMCQASFCVLFGVSCCVICEYCKRQLTLKQHEEL